MRIAIEGLAARHPAAASGSLPALKPLTLAVAPGSGHRVPWEAGDWLAQRVAHFLKVGC